MTVARFSFGGLQGACPGLPEGGLEPLECVAAGAGTVVLVVLGGALVFGAYHYLKSRWTRKSRGPVFLFSHRHVSGAPPHREWERPGAMLPPRWEPYPGSPSTATPRPAPGRNPEGPRARPAPPGPSTRGRGWDESATQRTTISPEVRAAAVGSSSPGGNRTSVAGGPGSMDGHRTSPVTQELPPDGTLQLLPGSLRIESGNGAGEIIRFVRVPGEEVAITFGRNQGPPHRHVQLRSPTASRVHARLTFRDRKWTLRNESATNPTVVNGRPLEGRPAEVLLRDGDRIEMGEIAFVFQQTEATSRLALRSSWYTDRGRRATNQDAVAVRTLPEGRELAIVCDGMGSHVSGGMASYIALEALVAALTQGEDLAHGVQEANRAVRRAAEADEGHDGMGTTLVALLRDGERYMVANVGDSRAYRVDQAGIRQLTRDHSFVAEAVGEGGMSLEEANRSPWRNAVTRNLGSESDVEVDLFGPFDATAPHLAILTTDGVHGVLSDDEVERLVRDTPDTRDLARALAEAALRNGSEDNVAVAVMDFSSGAGEAR
jgi:PPM family protein phosphatase